MVFVIKASGTTQVSSITSKITAFADPSNVPPEVVRKGVRYAKARAPYDTGALRDAINGRYGSKNAGVFVKTPNHPDGRRRPYMLWHHGYGIYPQVESGPTSPNSGDHKFMFSTAEYMKRKALEEYRERFR